MSAQSFYKIKNLCKKTLLEKKEKRISVGLNLVKKKYIAFCMFLKYSHGKQVIYLYRIIYAVKCKYIYFKQTAH